MEIELSKERIVNRTNQGSLTYPMLTTDWTQKLSRAS